MSSDSYTPLDEIPKIRDAVRAGFATNRSRDVAFRKTQLLQIAYMMQDNTERFQLALAGDLGRPALESIFLEISAVQKEALTAYKRVATWAKPEGVPFDFNTFAMRGKTLKDPQGVVLIIGPFNYPLWCLITPLIGAVAAGCGVVMKPSELASNVEKLLVELIPKYLDQDLYRVVTAEIPGTTKLLELQWDHIMYTGNGTVGKIVATAAAKFLTPVSLELGGKSPAIVDETADLTVTAKRLLWGKAANAGQTCVAPDYVLVTNGRQDALVAAFQKVYEDFYPKAAGGPDKSESMSRIIADRHFQRLEKMLKETKGEVVLGGSTDAATKYIAPTIIKNVKEDDSTMASEIFGPLLPIVPVPDIKSAIEFVNARDRPLALYTFSTSSKNKETILNSTFSGMAMANDCILAAAVEGLPFGGTGPAGYGSHSDKSGFDAFTHRRATIDSPGWLDLVLGFRFPPYTDGKVKMAKLLLQPKIGPKRPGTPSSSWFKLSLIFSLVFALAGVSKKLLGTKSLKA